MTQDPKNKGRPKLAAFLIFVFFSILVSLLAVQYTPFLAIFTLAFLILCSVILIFSSAVAKHFLIEFTGITYIFDKIKPKAQGVPSTFAFWVLGIYVGCYGLASQIHQESASRIGSLANTVYNSSFRGSQIDLTSLEYIPKIQHLPCPKKPILHNPLVTVHSLFGAEEPYIASVELLTLTLLMNKEKLKCEKLFCLNLDGLIGTNGKDLVDYQGAQIINVRLRGSYFRNANFEGANLSNSDFRGADLRGAIFIGCTLIGTDFRDANLSGAHFGVSVEVGAAPTGDLPPKDYMGMKIEGANIKDLHAPKDLIDWAFKDTVRLDQDDWLKHRKKQNQFQSNYSISDFQKIFENP